MQQNRNEHFDKPDPEVSEHQAPVDNTLFAIPIEELYLLKEGYLKRINTLQELMFSNESSNVISLDKHAELKNIKQKLAQVQYVIDFHQGHLPILPEDSSRVAPASQPKPITEMSKLELIAKRTELQKEREALNAESPDLAKNTDQLNQINALLDRISEAQHHNENIVGKGEYVVR